MLTEKLKKIIFGHTAPKIAILVLTPLHPLRKTFVFIELSRRLKQQNDRIFNLSFLKVKFF